MARLLSVAAHALWARGTARRVEYCAVIGRRTYRYLVYIAIQAGLSSRPASDLGRTLGRPLFKHFVRSLMLPVSVLTKDLKL